MLSGLFYWGEYTEMSDLRDDEQLELGFERGKRVEFIYDDPEVQEEKAPEIKEEQSADAKPHRRRRKATVIALVAAAFCAILAGVFFCFYGRHIGGLRTAEETLSAEETHHAESTQSALTLSEDYAAHLEALKQYLTQLYPFAGISEMKENGEYSLKDQTILVADLDGDGARPEAVILTERVTSAKDLLSSVVDADEGFELKIIFFDLADRIQTCSVTVPHEELPVQSLMLNLKEDNTAQLILYKQDALNGTDCSLLYEYNSSGLAGTIGDESYRDISDMPYVYSSCGSAILQKLGEVSGRLASYVITGKNGEGHICYDLDGVYQVRETVSGNNGYGDYAYERVYSYMLDGDLNTLMRMGLNGTVESYPEDETFLTYYELENTSWWHMRRPLLAVMPKSNMTEQELYARQQEVLYGTAAHMIGGFSGTDMYLVETDYGDRGVILLRDQNDLDACMIGMQGLPFFEVFALEEQETFSEELYAYLDMHITTPGYYKIDGPCYIWIDLNGDGLEHRFLVDEQIDIANQSGAETLIPFYVEHSGDTVRYLTVTDLDPADHRMEIGISEFFSDSEDGVPLNRAFTRLYQSLDGSHLVQIPEPQVHYLYSNGVELNYYFMPFDPLTGEANYEGGKVQLEFAASPDYIVWAVYDGQKLQIIDDTFAILREPVRTVTASSELRVYEETAPDMETGLALPAGTAVVVDGFMLKADTDITDIYSTNALLYKLHLSTDQGVYYTDYMALQVIRERLGLSGFTGVPHQE